MCRPQLFAGDLLSLFIDFVSVENSTRSQLCIVICSNFFIKKVTAFLSFRILDLCSCSIFYSRHILKVILFDNLKKVYRLAF